MAGCARDGRYRSRLHRGGGSPDRHQKAGTAAATGRAWSDEFDASMPGDSRGARSQDSLDNRCLGDHLQQERRDLPVLASKGRRPRTSGRTVRPSRERAARSSEGPESAPVETERASRHVIDSSSVAPARQARSRLAGRDTSRESNEPCASRCPAARCAERHVRGKGHSRTCPGRGGHVTALRMTSRPRRGFPFAHPSAASG
jgi:hypothetical protein